MEIIPIFVGVIFMGIGGYLLFDTYNFRQISHQVSGRVLGYESHQSRNSNGGSSTFYAPVIEFSCKGNTYCFKATISSNSMSYPIGSEVPVLYLESNPHNARIRTNMRFILGGIFTLMGGIAFTIGVVNFSFNWITLIVGLALLGKLGHMAIKFKSKLNAQGIHTLDEFKAKIKESKTNKSAGDKFGETETSEKMLSVNGLPPEQPARAKAAKNYIPSQSMISDQSTQDKHLKLPGWLVAVTFTLAGGLILGGGYWTKTRYEFLSIAESTSGKVVSMESSYSDGSTVYYPIVQYTYPVDNQTVEFKHSVGSSHPGWQTGDIVMVLYHPQDKDDAMIDDGWLNWLGPIIVLGMGGIFLLAAFFTFKKARKQRAK